MVVVGVDAIGFRFGAKRNKYKYEVLVHGVVSFLLLSSPHSFIQSPANVVSCKTNLPVVQIRVLKTIILMQLMLQ